MFVVAALLPAAYFLGYAGALPLYADLFGLCSALFGRIYVFTCAAVDFVAAAPVQSVFPWGSRPCAGGPEGKE